MLPIVLARCVLRADIQTLNSEAQTVVLVVHP